jgi:transcriptional regulator with XRE-family HTH domain
VQAIRFVLNDQRGIRNLSKHRFSIKCGFSKQYVSLIESGRRVPRLEFLFGFAYGLDMSIKDFMLLITDKIAYYEELYEKRASNK